MLRAPLIIIRRKEFVESRQISAVVVKRNATQGGTKAFLVSLSSLQ